MPHSLRKKTGAESNSWIAVEIENTQCLYAHVVLTLCAYCNARLTQEKTGAEGVIGTTSAVQQVVEECGVPVVSVVGMSHLTEYMASKENATPGANAQVRPSREERSCAITEAL